MFPSYKKPFSFLFNRVCYKYFPDISYSIYHFVSYDFEHYTKINIFSRFINNPIHDSDQIDTFCKIYNDTRRLYKVFQRFYENHSRKKTMVYCCDTNLNLEPLSSFNSKSKYSLLHMNVLYTFTVSDMLNVIKNDLLKHDRFFSDATFPRNPYNNIPFTETNMYNFYYFLLHNNYKIPELFRRFFNSGFSIHTFIRNNEFLIRQLIIEEYHKQITDDQLYEEIILFLRSIKSYSLFIHIDFPKKEVVQHYRHIFTCYLHAKHDLSFISRDYYKDEMNKQLLISIYNTPMFGRIQLTPNKYSGAKFPHGHYKIVNMLDHTIPQFESLNELYIYMENGRRVVNSNIYRGDNTNWGVNNDDDSNDDESDDDESYDNNNDDSDDDISDLDSEED
jgi:hypothetical protein